VFINVLLVVLICIAASSIFTVFDECHPGKNNEGDCVLSNICFGCKEIWLRYTVLLLTVLISLFFGIPAVLLCTIHLKNYCKGQTTNERFAKRHITSSVQSSEDLSESLHSDRAAHNKRGCLSNFSMMCCQKKIVS
jgi:hypothetical protein